MAQNSNTPPLGGVSRKRCGGCFRDNLTRAGAPVQFFVAVRFNRKLARRRFPIARLWKGSARHD